MATVKHRIGEVDVVELRDAVGKWPAGTRGAVIDHGEAKMVEIADERGVALDFLDVPESRLKLVTKHSV